MRLAKTEENIVDKTVLVNLNIENKKKKDNWNRIEINKVRTKIQISSIHRQY